MDTKAFFKMSYGVYLLSSAYNEKQNGCVVNTVTQVTSQPAQLSVAVSKNNFTAGLISQSGLFNAVALTENATMDLIGRFGFHSGKDTDKFSGIACEKDINGILYSTEASAALFSCKVVQTLDLGSHLMFIGEVMDAKTLLNDPVMTYSYYHQVKKGVTPPNAPSYKKPEQKTGWRCTVCGYIYEGEVLPPDFICPVCGKDASFFEKI